MQASTIIRVRGALMTGAFLAASWIMVSPGVAEAQQAAPSAGTIGQPSAVSSGTQIQLAQQTTPPPPPVVAPAPPPPPAAQPGYLFDMSSMGTSFGNMLKSYGIYLNGGSETNLFGWISGGRKTGVNMQGENTLGADFDMNHIAGIPGAAVHISVDERWGQNPGGFAGMANLTTANYGPQDNVRLGELSWDQDLANDHIRILVGRIADNIDFNTSEITCRFLFDICGNYSSMWYLTNNNPSYPVATWGGRMTVKPTLETYLRFGAYQETTAAAGLNTFSQSFDFGHNTGVFIPVEMGYKTNGDQSPFPTGAYIGGWYDSSRYTDAFGHSFQGRSAIYGEFQQMIYRPDPKGDRGLTLFGEAMIGTSDLGPISNNFTGGFSWVGPMASRPGDQLNLGFTYEGMNRSYQHAFQRGCIADSAYYPGVTGLARSYACSPYASSNWIVELNYNYKLAPGISIIPAVAYFINPNPGDTFPGSSIPPTTTHFKNAWMVGAQLAIGLNGAFGLPAFVRTD